MRYGEGDSMRYLLFTLIAAAAAGQPAPDPFAPLRLLEGRWEGAAAGEPGKGVSTRSTSSTSPVDF